ncbi:MAG TPA: ABC transporter permease [Acidimicrobiales bacterium]|nr:ABC transporter permease [Acidimicrobiales bacterium]
MLAITLQDLRYRWRQFIIAVVGAGLVFAMTLLLAGLAAGFSKEIDQTVQSVGAQSWVMAAGASGRLAAMPPIAQSNAALVATEPGVHRADPLIVIPQAAEIPGLTQAQSVNLVGAEPGGLGSVAPTIGHRVENDDQAVVDSVFDVHMGGSFAVAGHVFRVVGVVTNRTLLGGTPDVYVSIGAAQRAVCGGRALIDAIVTLGRPSTVPVGLQVLTNAQVESASLHQMSSAVSSINNSKGFMWAIAAIIVAALIYVTALERTRDFAVLKALGSSSRLLFAGLATQAVAVTLIAAIVAAGISHFMTGLFAQPVAIPGSAFVVLPISAVIVGLVASVAALRRAVSVDPAAAFAGA